MLNDEQKDELDIRLENTWTGSHACPICGRDNWNRIDMIFNQTLSDNPQDKELGGLDVSDLRDASAPTLPLIYMSCYTCGYVMAFNAITLKLVRPVLKRAEDEEEPSSIAHISDSLRLAATPTSTLYKESTPIEPVHAPIKHSHSKHDAHILEMHIDSLMGQSVNFMILGGLVSLIALANQSDAFIRIYLSNVVWYFLAAIFVYFFTSSKEYTRNIGDLLGTHKRVAKARKAEKAGEQVRPEDEHTPNVDRTFKLLAANKILVMLFIISFIVHFYMYQLGKAALSGREEWLFNFALLSLGTAIYSFVEGRPKKSV